MGEVIINKASVFQPRATHFFGMRPLTLLLIVIKGIQAPSFDSRFTKVDPGDDVTGNAVENHLYITSDECIVRCSGSAVCQACQYNGTPPGNCTLISEVSSSGDGTIFMSNFSNIIYQKVYSSGSIPERGEWAGPQPVLYWSFDNLDGLVLMEGTEPKDYDALTEGKVKSALTLAHTREQWVDLGVQTQACLILPDSCGPEGAAVALWVKIDFCSGIISSFSALSGFMIYCIPDQRLVFWVSLSNVYMYKVISKVDNQWIHLVLSFIGSEERFQVFKDGALVPRQQTKAYFSRPLGDGRLVLGRRHPSTDDFYSSVDLDELVFFNRKFTEPEVTKLYNNYN